MLSNIHAIENEDCKSLFWRIYGVFIAHESCSFKEQRGWNVILYLWYFELYSVLYFIYFIQQKDGDMRGHERL
jgi:hypothetical protein